MIALFGVVPAFLVMVVGGMISVDIERKGRELWKLRSVIAVVLTLIVAMSWIFLIAQESVR